jgi:hypothetical protein
VERVELFFEADLTCGATAVRPSRTLTPFSKPNSIDGTQYIAHDWKKKRVLMEDGYVIRPNDCPPIRNLNSYGFEVFAAANSYVKRNEQQLARRTDSSEARLGWYTHSGDRCATSDSGFFTSWLGNSEYFKVITGVIIYCPVGYGLYQGGGPYTVGAQFDTLAAIEYGNSRGTIEFSGQNYFMVEMNLVCSFSSGEIHIKRGQPLGVFYPVLSPNRAVLNDRI